MIALDVITLATVMAPSVLHRSRLGAADANTYHHLYEPAGAFSRPTSVARGVTRQWCEPYNAPAAAAGVRISDLAVAAAHAAAAPFGRAPLDVTDVLHAQCTLDEQILSSVCLRVKSEVFARARDSVAIGQAGTTGAAVALGLAATIIGPDAAVAITSADKWIAPFFRKRGDVPMADAAACCIVGRHPRPIARIVALHNLVGAPLDDFWAADGAAFDRHTTGLAIAAIEGLRQRIGSLPADARIAGDARTSATDETVSNRVAIRPLDAPIEGRRGIHLGSAALIAALDDGVAVAVARGVKIPLVLWTACPSGHAAAALVLCRPDARATTHGWSAFPAVAQ